MITFEFAASSLFILICLISTKVGGTGALLSAHPLPDNAGCLDLPVRNVPVLPQEIVFVLHELIALFLIERYRPGRCLPGTDEEIAGIDASFDEPEEH